MLGMPTPAQKRLPRGHRPNIYFPARSSKRGQSCCTHQGPFAHRWNDDTTCLGRPEERALFVLSSCRNSLLEPIPKSDSKLAYLSPKTRLSRCGRSPSSKHTQRKQATHSAMASENTKSYTPRLETTEALTIQHYLLLATD
jgi:hypothetical protein